MEMMMTGVIDNIAATVTTKTVIMSILYTVHKRLYYTENEWHLCGQIIFKLSDIVIMIQYHVDKFQCTLLINRLTSFNVLNIMSSQNVL